MSDRLRISSNPEFNIQQQEELRMHKTCNTHRRTLSATRRLVRKHHFQIVAGPQYPELTDMFAITFRPSDRTSTFNGKLLQRAGMSVMVVLSYEADVSKPDRLAMPIRGFRAQANPDSSMLYGGEAGCSFLYNGALRPRPHAVGRAISASRNPSLAELLLTMDRACRRRLDRRDALLQVPQLPAILLGFAPDQPPEFEDSPALRRLAAQELDVPPERLGANGSVLLDRLLHDIWERHLIQPSVASNGTGKLLVNAELCKQARRALEIYEDFRGLVGMHTWNPARGVEFLRMYNPAKTVLRRHGIDMHQDFNQYFPDELIDQLELAMREAVGEASAYFTREEVFDALTSPHLPLVGFATSLLQLRSKLSAQISECVTDDDLLRAARKPSEPLLASGACRVQVLAKPGHVASASLHFTPDVLGRRIEADLRENAWDNRLTQNHSCRPRRDERYSKPKALVQTESVTSGK
jgi:hypothetical protein